MPMLRLIDPQGSGQEGSIPPPVSFGITPISVDDARVVITSVDVLISHVSPSILVHFESIFGRDVATSLFVPLEGSGDLRVLRGPLQSTLVRRWRGRNIALRRSRLGSSPGLLPAGFGSPAAGPSAASMDAALQLSAIQSMMARSAAASNPYAAYPPGLAGLAGYPGFPPPPGAAPRKDN